jgi:hypothetical protein
MEHMHASCKEVRLLGFAHYRFVVEEEMLVVYVYELQMETSGQIACKVLFFSGSSLQFLYNIILLFSFFVSTSCMF